MLILVARSSCANYRHEYINRYRKISHSLKVQQNAMCGFSAIVVLELEHQIISPDIAMSENFQHIKRRTLHNVDDFEDFLIEILLQ